jgi:hypothetical protein
MVVAVGPIGQHDGAVAHRDVVVVVDELVVGQLQSTECAWPVPASAK